MSDLNDDLLNYELGEELDDPTLADEDELLLSDEEHEKDVSSVQKATLKNEAEEWVTSNLKTKSNNKKDDSTAKKTDDVVTTSSSCNEASSERDVPIRNSDTQTDSNVSTSEELPISNNSQSQEEKSRRNSENDQQSKNDEVTSTNKEIEDQSVSQTVAVNKSEHNLVKEEIIQSSQETTSIAVEADEIFSDPREDSEERTERTNIKQTNERGAHSETSEKNQFVKFGPSKRGRGGVIMRGGPYPGPRGLIRYPNVHYPQYPPHPNEPFNPQNQYSYQLNDAPMQPFPMPNQMPPRMEHRPLGPGFRPPNPNEFMYRPRNEFVNGSNTYYAPPGQVRPVFRQEGNVPLGPQVHIRHRMPLPPRAPGLPPPQGQPTAYLGPASVPNSQHLPVPNTNHPNNFTILANVQASGQSGVTSAVIPRKVLINPNFKGGVEAATSQLMKDTQFMQTISSHAVHLQSDEELLRQQEEFIKRNRMHIEKRRYDRSPDRNRSRSRERSYSPVRRERRGNSRERRGGSPRGRPRRANSRENEDRFPKRRRSGSFDRKKGDKLEEEEDEETRAYRQEIEKQKAMREKILRDKEMRRRKAAEEKQVDEKVSTDEGSSQKLKPIIVTESKIISLKKKSNTELSTSVTQTITTPSKSKTVVTQQYQQQTIQRKIPTAKILPEAKYNKSEQYAVKDASTTTLNPTATMAVIKPVIKKTISVQADIDTNLEDDDDNNDENESLDEELLLAETPSPPSSPLPLPPSSSSFMKKSKRSTTSKTNTTSTGGSGNKFSSSNRRVVLKSSIKKHDNIKDTSSSDINRKPIFDRLEKKIGVNESVKKKIQRIVIKNAE